MTPVGSDGVQSFQVSATAYDGHVGRSGSQLAQGLMSAGLQDITTHELRPSMRYSSFGEIWTPLMAGVAPSGAYLLSLNLPSQEALRREVYRLVGSPGAKRARYEVRHPHVPPVRRRLLIAQELNGHPQADPAPGGQERVGQEEVSALLVKPPMRGTADIVLRIGADTSLRKPAPAAGE